MEDLQVEDQSLQVEMFCVQRQFIGTMLAEANTKTIYQLRKKEKKINCQAAPFLGDMKVKNIELYAKLKNSTRSANQSMPTKSIWYN